MSGVLRGFAPAAYEKAVCGVPSVRLNENPCAALLIKKNSSFMNWKLKLRPTLVTLFVDGHSLVFLVILVFLSLIQVAPRLFEECVGFGKDFL